MHLARRLEMRVALPIPCPRPGAVGRFDWALGPEPWALDVRFPRKPYRSPPRPSWRRPQDGAADGFSAAGRGTAGGAQALSNAVERVRRCASCRNYCDEEVCPICRNDRRSKETLCVVETPADLLALEQATGYSGRYFVLHGRLSPLDGCGPEELGLAHLAQRLGDEPVSELILAINPTVEGEATAHLLAEIAQAAQIKVTRLAHGIPVGGELEYTDRHTLAHAFGGRQTMQR